MAVHTILYPPTIDYDWLVQRPQQLMKAFAALGIKVFYMNPGTHTSNKRGVTRLSPNLMILNNVDPKVYMKQRPVFYFSSPPHVDLIPRYNPSLVVFDYLDEPVEEFVSLAPYLRRALTSADLVITSSKKLYHHSLAVNSNTILVPNGCDFDHFARAHHLGRHEHLVAVDRRAAGHAEQRKLLLRVERHDARRAEAEEFDAVGHAQRRDRPPQRFRVEMAARPVQRARDLRFPRNDSIGIEPQHQRVVAAITTDWWRWPPRKRAARQFPS